MSYSEDEFYEDSLVRRLHALNTGDENDESDPPPIGRFNRSGGSVSY